MNRRYVLVLSVVAIFGFAACSNDDKELRLSGGVENFTIDPKFTKFCAAYDDLNIALNDMTERGTNKETFAVVLAKSKALVDLAPDDIVESIITNDAILNAMNQAFADRDYDEEKISTDEGLRQEVRQLYAQDGLPELTSQYADYLVKNCGVSVDGN